jgi:hypothetical protein
LWRRIVRKIVLAVIGLVLLAIVVLSVWNYIESKQLNEEIAKIRATGEPVTFEELKARLPPINEAQNAARYYEAGMSLLLQPKDITNCREELRKALETCPTSQPAEELLKQTDRLLADNRETLEMFDKGAALPACRFDPGVRYDMAGIFDQSATIRQAARLLSLRTMARMMHGDGDGAVDSVISTLCVTRLCDYPPMLIWSLVKVAIVGVACSDTELILQHAHLSDGSLVKLQDELARSFSSDALQKIIAGERMYTVEMMRNVIPNPSRLEFGHGSPAWPEALPSRLWWVPWIRQWMVGQLRYLADARDAAQKPWPEAMDAIEAIKKPNGMLAKILVPTYSRITVNQARAEAGVRCAMVAIAIERYRRTTNGRRPDVLSELTPKYIKSVPLDPFSGKELLYHQDKDSYVVYSVNENRQDDGGALEVRLVQGRKDFLDWGVRIHLQPADNSP